MFLQKGYEHTYAIADNQRTLIKNIETNRTVMRNKKNTFEISWTHRPAFTVGIWIVLTVYKCILHHLFVDN